MAEGALDDMSDVARGCFGALIIFVASGLFVVAILGVEIFNLVHRMNV